LFFRDLIERQLFVVAFVADLVEEVIDVPPIELSSDPNRLYSLRVASEFPKMVS